MPQASPELRAEWVDDETAIKFLVTRGYQLTRKWQWKPPKDAAGNRVAPTAIELRAIRYLFRGMGFRWDRAEMSYRTLVANEIINQIIYKINADFDKAMRAVAWDDILVSISRIRDQIEAMEQSFTHASRRMQRLPVYDKPPPPPREPHHAHLIKQHIRSARKPAKHARNSRQIMVAAIPHRQTRRNKRKVKKMEQR